MYYLTVLKVRNPKIKMSAEESWFPCLFQLLEVTCIPLPQGTFLHLQGLQHSIFTSVSLVLSCSLRPLFRLLHLFPDPLASPLYKDLVVTLCPPGNPAWSSHLYILTFAESLRILESGHGYFGGNYSVYHRYLLLYGRGAIIVQNTNSLRGMPGCLVPGTTHALLTNQDADLFSCWVVGWPVQPLSHCLFLCIVPGTIFVTAGSLGSWWQGGIEHAGKFHV